MSVMSPAERAAMVAQVNTSNAAVRPVLKERLDELIAACVAVEEETERLIPMGDDEVNRIKNIVNNAVVGARGQITAHVLPMLAANAPPA